MNFGTPGWRALSFPIFYTFFCQIHQSDIHAWHVCLQFTVKCSRANRQISGEIPYVGMWDLPTGCRRLRAADVKATSPKWQSFAGYIPRVLVARLASGPYRNSPSRSIFRFPLLSARQNELKVEESWQLSGPMGAIALCIPKVLFVKQSNRNLVMVTGRWLKWVLPYSLLQKCFWIAESISCCQFLRP